MYKEYTYTVLLRLQTSPHCVISVDSQGSTTLTNCRNFQKCFEFYFERRRYICPVHNAVARIRPREKICHIVLLTYYHERILVLIVKQCSIRHNAI